VNGVSDRLRWIADFVGVAGNALSVVACVRGIDYSQDVHDSAQRDLRALAALLDQCPALRADLAAAMTEDLSALPGDGRGCGV
jgi:hypothetical protein